MSRNSIRDTPKRALSREEQGPLFRRLLYDVVASVIAGVVALVMLVVGLRSKTGKDQTGCLPMWGFPKIRGSFLGILIKGIIVFWRLYWGPLVLGNYHV